MRVRLQARAQITKAWTDNANQALPTLCGRANSKANQPCLDPVATRSAPNKAICLRKRLYGTIACSKTTFAPHGLMGKASGF